MARRWIGKDEAKWVEKTRRVRFENGSVGQLLVGKREGNPSVDLSQGLDYVRK